MNDLYISKIESSSLNTFTLNQAIIELLRISYLHLHPECNQKSSNFDEEIRTDFLNSFSHAIDEFSKKLNSIWVQRYLLIDESSYIEPDFLNMVDIWTNPPRTHLDEFHKELRICLQEQVLWTILIINNTQFHRENGQVILSLLEKFPEIKKSLNIEGKQEIISEVVEQILA